MYTSLSKLPDGIDGLLYRNGFVLSATEPTGAPFASWKRHRLGAMKLVTHPETSCIVCSRNGRTGALIGVAFDPEEGVYQEGSVINSLVDAYGNDDVFFEILDRLAGRFVFIVNAGNFTDIFHDAMGSRSVFYSSAGTAVVASHAEIVARMIGSDFADFFVPFITSRNYTQRDVKYLPGLATSYNDVRQLTPNTRVRMPAQSVERYWPRESSSLTSDNEGATRKLVEHLSGVAAYLKIGGIRPIMGLTAGTDSRGLFSASWGLDPYIFTYIRSREGEQTASNDSRVAIQLAETYGLSVNVWQLSNRRSLNAMHNPFSYAFRRSTGYYRGDGSEWLRRLSTEGFGGKDALFIRGFGGEIMRGFYQAQSKNIRRIHPYQLSDTYGVNAGSTITRSLFTEMMDTVSFNEKSLFGYDPNDIFYWEHRMGTWGSLAMSEADLAIPSMVAYSSRNLYATFMRLPWSDRESRRAFHDATLRLAPSLEGITI